MAAEIIKGRELLGLTQAQLCERSGVSLSALKGYETGRNQPGARELRQLCEVLRLSPNRLLFGAENPFPERTWSDAALSNVEVNAPTAGRRIAHLLEMLSSSESQALFQVVHALAVARHGVEKVHPLLRAADLETGVDVFAEEDRFVPYLHAKLLRHTAVARRYAAALLVAADETDKYNAARAPEQNSAAAPPKKVSKK